MYFDFQKNNEHVTRMDAERLVKIVRENISAGKRSSGHQKKRMERLNTWLKQAESPITKKKKKI